MITRTGRSTEKNSAIFLKSVIAAKPEKFSYTIGGVERNFTIHHFDPLDAGRKIRSVTYKSDFLMSIDSKGTPSREALFHFNINGTFSAQHLRFILRVCTNVKLI